MQIISAALGQKVCRPIIGLAHCCCVLSFECPLRTSDKLRLSPKLREFGRAANKWPAGRSWTELNGHNSAPLSSCFIRFTQTPTLARAGAPNAQEQPALCFFFCGGGGGGGGQEKSRELCVGGNTLRALEATRTTLATEFARLLHLRRDYYFPPSACSKLVANGHEGRRRLCRAPTARGQQLVGCFVLRSPSHNCSGRALGPKAAKFASSSRREWLRDGPAQLAYKWERKFATWRRRKHFAADAARAPETLKHIKLLLAKGWRLSERVSKRKSERKSERANERTSG